MNGLTVGFFDGVHLGHQALLSRLCSRCDHSRVITFDNHPLSLLDPERAPPLLLSPEQRRELLLQTGVDEVILLPFTSSLAAQSPEEFLRPYLPFDLLLLGHDTRLGRGRSGDPAHLADLGEQLGFRTEQIEPTLLHDQPVSSSWVRSAIESGDLPLTRTLLGRPLSYSGQVIRGAGKGSRIGFPTANLDLSGYCLPPFGVYAITALIDGKRFPGVANLGVAPTLQQHRPPHLESHLFDVELHLVDQPIEVTLHRFLRPEKRFSSVDELTAQIAADIAHARSL